MNIRTLFIGTGEFAIPILEKLQAMDYVEVVGVITQPDKPMGRKQELTPGPLKRAILDKSIELKTYQPEKLRLEAEQILDETKPDLIIVAAYGQMIPDIMLAQPKYKCLNLHGSLLPQLRGAVPVPMAILQGLEKTGVTIQRMVKELDAGPVIGMQELVLTGKETTETLMTDLAAVGVDLLTKILPDWVAGNIKEQPQDELQATFCYQDDIAKEKAEIKFETSLVDAERMVRAFYPWPVAWVNLGNQKESANQKLETKRVKIFSAINVSDFKFQASNLTLVKDSGRLFLVLAEGCLELLDVQLEGKQRRDAKDYLYLAD